MRVVGDHKKWFQAIGKGHGYYWSDSYAPTLSGEGYRRVFAASFVASHKSLKHVMGCLKRVHHAALVFAARAARVLSMAAEMKLDDKAWRILPTKPETQSI